MLYSHYRIVLIQFYCHLYGNGENRKKYEIFLKSLIFSLFCLQIELQLPFQITENVLVRGKISGMIDKADFFFKAGGRC